MKLPFEHRINRTHKYTRAAETDIRKTIEAARKALEPKKKPTNVQQMRKKVAA